MRAGPEFLPDPSLPSDSRPRATCRWGARRSSPTTPSLSSPPTSSPPCRPHDLKPGPGSGSTRGRSSGGCGEGGPDWAGPHGQPGPGLTRALMAVSARLTLQRGQVGALAGPWEGRGEGRGEGSERPLSEWALSGAFAGGGEAGRGRVAVLVEDGLPCADGLPVEDGLPSLTATGRSRAGAAWLRRPCSCVWGGSDGCTLMTGGDREVTGCAGRVVLARNNPTGPAALQTDRHGTSLHQTKLLFRGGSWPRQPPPLAPAPPWRRLVRMRPCPERLPTRRQSVRLGAARRASPRPRRSESRGGHVAALEAV